MVTPMERICSPSSRVGGRDSRVREYEEKEKCIQMLHHLPPSGAGDERRRRMAVTGGLIPTSSQRNSREKTLIFLTEAESKTTSANVGGSSGDELLCL